MRPILVLAMTAACLHCAIAEATRERALAATRGDHRAFAAALARERQLRGRTGQANYAFDSKHPRGGKGSPQGGRFVTKNGGAGGDQKPKGGRASPIAAAVPSAAAGGQVFARDSRMTPHEITAQLEAAEVGNEVQDGLVAAGYYANRSPRAAEGDRSFDLYVEVGKPHRHGKHWLVQVHLYDGQSAHGRSVGIIRVTLPVKASGASFKASYGWLKGPARPPDPPD